ncbi:MAG: glycosyltransferase family 39 protein [Verrucomicrobiota bacterium]
MSNRWQWIGLAVIIAVGAWLRFSHFDLLEFQGDEAYAAHLALDALKTGKLPLAGLMSSVGVTNPPLFAYLLIPMFAINPNPAFVSACIALLGLAAVVITWHIGRKYYGPMAGLVAGLFFAVSPWAVIYSRKIWAQDFVPFFATCTLWAVHALVVGKKPKTVFWCVLLPLCVVQIHFSGIALTAAVVAIIAWLRPKIDWRWAAGGVVASLVLMAPYFYLQQQTGWGDFKQAMNTVGGGQQWEKLNGVTTHPVSGYRLPSKQNISYALAIMNGGRMEDVLGIAGGKEFDARNIWGAKHSYFEAGIWDAALLLQRLAFVAALIWVGFEVAKLRMKSAPTILVAWLVLPVAVFFVGGLWTYLTYFAILYPGHFLVCGEAGRKLKPMVAGAIAVVFAVANIAFMQEYYRFVDSTGGAQGTFGTALGHKQAAARYLAEQGGERLQHESAIQLELSTARTQAAREELGRKLGQPQLLELNHEGRPELVQLEWPLLITQASAGRGAPTLGTNTTVIMVDGNREALQPAQWQQLAQYPSTNFGPIKLFFVSR